MRGCVASLVQVSFCASKLFGLKRLSKLFQSLLNQHTAPAVTKRLLKLLMPKVLGPALSAIILIASYTLTTGAEAQNGVKNIEKPLAWPSRPVHIIVGFPGGSSPDLTARILAEPLSRALGQPIIIDNRPGASGNIATDLIAKARDDHTLGIVINGNLTSAKMLYPRLPYDPTLDFAPISLLTTAPMVLVSGAGQPQGAAFFKVAQQNGDRWNYGSVGNGSVSHLGMELIKSTRQGLLAVHIPFSGNPQVVTALIGEQIQMALMPPGIAMPQVRAGRLTAVGLTSGRSALVPDVAPLADTGLPGLENINLEVWNALVGPSTLSKAAQNRLAVEIPRIMRDPETRQKFFTQGWQAVGTSAEGLTNRLRKETASLGHIIKTRDIRLD